MLQSWENVNLLAGNKFLSAIQYLGFRGGVSHKEPSFKGCGFEPWIRKIPWRSMATHSSVLAWRIPWTEEAGGLYRPCGHKESDMTERLTQPKFETV